jgi:hypothetical protein
MAANPEYLDVLSQIVGCIREAMRDARLPDLTPEQVTDWLRSVTTEDVHAIWDAKARIARLGSE